MAAPIRIAGAPKHPRGFYEARPGDVAGRDDLLLVDVRQEASDLLGDMGHIHGVTHLPREVVTEIDHPIDAPVVVVCNNGRTSRRAAVDLVAAGFQEVYHLVGGMLRWTAEERPIARVQTWREASRRR